MLSAIVLAAGRGSRMGTLKQLLPWQGKKTLLETVVETVLACPAIDDEVRVVLGADQERVARVLGAMQDPRLNLVTNQFYQQGMLTSIQAGIKDLPVNTCAFALFLADQPLLTPSLVANLVRHWFKLKPEFMVPVHQGRRGHPVFISKKYVPEILALADADGGLRNFLRGYADAVSYCPTNSPAIYIDLDYPEEYQKYRPEKGE